MTDRKQRWIDPRQVESWENAQARKTNPGAQPNTKAKEKKIIPRDTNGKKIAKTLVAVFCIVAAVPVIAYFGFDLMPVELLNMASERISEAMDSNSSDPEPTLPPVIRY